MRRPLPTPTLDELGSLLKLGVSVLAATRDANMRPAISRCGGARVGNDGLVRVAIALPEGARTLANLESTGVIALTAVLPTTYRTLQVKGREARRVEWPELDQIVISHRAAFVEEVLAIGLARENAPVMWSTRFVAIAFTPDEIFDQTPGPSAGLAFVA
ncbi:MAG: hypothetical protein JWP87_3620 [Labilithrix sp.]|nr:hypothetical protein [Labilithrix sp.]